MATSLRPRRMIALASALATASFVLVAGPTSAATTSTTTTLYAPNLIQAGVPTTLVAQVSQDPTAGPPIGTVTFSTGYGAQLGTAAVSAITAGASQATLAWTPPATFSVPVVATFTPSGTASASSVSNIQRPEITTAPVPVALRFAPTLTAGPTYLDGVLGYSFGPGSVSFLVDGKGWTGSVPTVGGVGTVTWNATPGIHTILVMYSSNAANPAGISAQSGYSSQIVNVLP
jgi:hypothetical protein